MNVHIAAYSFIECVRLRRGRGTHLYKLSYYFFTNLFTQTRLSRRKSNINEKVVDARDLPMVDPDELDAIDVDEFWEIYNKEGGGKSLGSTGSPTVCPGKKILPQVRIMRGLFGRSFTECSHDNDKLSNYYDFGRVARSVMWGCGGGYVRISKGGHGLSI